MTSFSEFSTYVKVVPKSRPMTSLALMVDSPWYVDQYVRRYVVERTN